MEIIQKACLPKIAVRGNKLITDGTCDCISKAEITDMARKMVDGDKAALVEGHPAIIPSGAEQIARGEITREAVTETAAFFNCPINDDTGRCMVQAMARHCDMTITNRGARMAALAAAEKMLRKMRKYGPHDVSKRVTGDVA